MNLIGKTTLHPLLFYTGKISGYATWIIFALSLFNFISLSGSPAGLLKTVSYGVLLVGLIIATISLINLGKSTRLGLPAEKTVFKTSGIYRFSRNPMYVGFDLLTIASMLYTFNLLVTLLGIYSLIIYHFIIVGEENFLEKRFGKAYLRYKKKVKRYF
jgi:protein-S-isoprenylcysteine O-methyltransferase Ste14